jgi:hypothetical protein
MKNSSTILLPCWFQLLEDLANNASLSNPLPIQMMLHDVVTHWNSTYQMLVFTLEYCQAIDEITVDRDMRKYELSEEEWPLVQQLCNVLAVCCAGY